MDDFYRELIIDRYKNPHFRGELDPADITFEDDNPLCGDHIRLQFALIATIRLSRLLSMVKDVQSLKHQQTCLLKQSMEKVLTK